MSDHLASRITGLLTVAALVLVGCGGADQTPTATPTATPTVQKAAERELAKQSTLQLEDFPSGWTQLDDEEHSPSICRTVEDVKKQTTARVTAPSFAHGSNTQVQNTIYLFADEQRAADAFELLTSEDTRGCYVQVVTKAFSGTAGLKVGKAQSGRLSVEPLGDDRDAARITVPITAKGVDVDVVVDIVFVRAKRGMTLTLFIDLGAPFDGGLRDQLTATSVRRLSESVGA